MPTGTRAAASSPPELAGRVSVLANDFVTTNVIAREMSGCESDGLVVDINLNTEIRDIQSRRPRVPTRLATAP